MALAAYSPRMKCSLLGRVQAIQTVVLVVLATADVHAQIAALDAVDPRQSI